MKPYDMLWYGIRRTNGRHKVLFNVCDILVSDCTYLVTPMMQTQKSGGHVTGGRRLSDRKHGNNLVRPSLPSPVPGCTR